MLLLNTGDQVQQEFIFVNYQTSIRHSSHWGRSLQNGLGDVWTYKMTMASAYVLYHLSAT